MPSVRETISAFGPDDLKILHDVFDRAWRRLLLEGLEGDDEVAVARRRLAKLGNWMSNYCSNSALIL
jgi:hypothetical protein